MKSFKHKIHKATIALVLSAVCIGSAALNGCSKSTDEYGKSGTYFDTVIRITVYDSDQLEYVDDCFAMAKHYEDLFSRTIDTSDVSRINNSNGAYVTVDPETIDLIEKGLEYCELSNGSFDITVGALSDLWHFSDNDGEIPNDADIQAAVANVDYHAIQINGDQVALTNPNAKLDLGGIAKGYIADRMKDYLKSKGVESATINLGGNVLTIGNKPNGDPYHIGIQKPFDEHGAVIAALTISDASMVSSGVYERYFDVNGKRYHHILDTSTGYPYDNGLLGITIVSKESVDGDGLSTTCFTLGLEKGMELIESLDDTEAVFITEDYKLHPTSGLTDKLDLID